MKQGSARRRILLLLIPFFVVVLLLPFRLDLVIKNRQGVELRRIPVRDAEVFDISFRHSVNKGMVIERYRIDRDTDSFYLETGWFESYGAGMMDQLSEGVVMTEEGDFLRLDFPRKDMREVSYAAAGIADHHLKIGMQEISLFKQNPYKTDIIFLEKISMADLLYHYVNR